MQQAGIRAQMQLGMFANPSHLHSQRSSLNDGLLIILDAPFTWLRQMITKTHQAGFTELGLSYLFKRVNPCLREVTA
jgi:hypothetical protein